MAVPKKKTSRSRRDKRRYSNTWQLSPLNTVKCPQCGSPTRQHRICDECGYYHSKQVIHPKSQEA